MPALLSVFLALWAIVGGHVTIHQLSGPVRFTDLYGSPREAAAATGCPNGRPEMWLSPDVDMATLVHETAHAVDCLDDGKMNDSPSLRPAVRPGWVSDYCWDSDAEWYACSVTYYLNVHPYLVARWGPQAMADAGIALPSLSSGAVKAGSQR
jgi:hypothetical protein